jgi:hypothetical protein
MTKAPSVMWKMKAAQMRKRRGVAQPLARPVVTSSRRCKSKKRRAGDVQIVIRFAVEKRPSPAMSKS